jgi:hypothetical protein
VTEEEVARIHRIDSVCLVVFPVIYASLAAIILQPVD